MANNTDGNGNGTNNGNGPGNGSGTDQYTGGIPNPLDPTQVGQAVGDGLSAAGTGVAAATGIGGFIGGLEADVLNVMNQIFNSAFYSFMTLAGLVLMIWGLYLIFKDTEAVSTAKGVASTAIKAAAIL